MVLPPEGNVISCAAPAWRSAIRAWLSAASTSGAGATSTANVTTSSAPAAVERTETARPLSARVKPRRRSAEEVACRVEHGIVLEQVRKRFGVGQVIDRYEFDVV